MTNQEIESQITKILSLSGNLTAGDIAHRIDEDVEKVLNALDRLEKARKVYVRNVGRGDRYYLN